jgi:hypothetical protein
MAKAYVYRNGSRLTPLMAYWFDRLDAAFFERWGLHLIVSSGIRLRSEQEAIFRSRYVTAGNVNGRRVYDTRWWKGVLWYRISSAGTVAQPDSVYANHVIENSGYGAIDIRDTGTDAGVLTAGSARDRWLHQIVDGKPRIEHYKYSNEGDGFGERWHKKFLLNPWGPAPKPPKPEPEPKKEEQEMLFVRSKKTNNWYIICEFTVTKIPAGDDGSENHVHALAYNKALGKSSVVLESSSVQGLLDDAAKRAKTFNAALAAEIEKMIEDESK